MGIVHHFSNGQGNATGTLTVWNGATTASVNATDVVRPQDWNSAHDQLFTLSGNTNGSSTVSGTNIVLQGMGGVTLVGSNDTLGISGPPSVTRNYFNPQDGYIQVTGQQGNGTMHVQPMYAPDVTFDRIAVPILVTNATNTTGTVTISYGVALYTRNSDSLSRLSSVSTTQAITYSGTVNNSTFAGLRLLTMGVTGSIPEDQYYVGCWSRTTTGGANCTVSQLLASQQNSNFSGILGAASNASVQYTRGLGQYSATFSTALPTSLALSQLNGTNSLVLRQPLFYMVNGTF